MDPRPQYWTLAAFALLASACTRPARHVPPTDVPASARPAATIAIPRLIIPRDFEPAPVLPPPSETRCYRFDQPYFHDRRAAAGETVATPDTSAFDRMRAEIRAALRERRVDPDPVLEYFADSVRLERSALVRLEPVPVETLRRDDGRLRLAALLTLPEITRRDPQGEVLFRRQGHYWRMLPGDSLEIAWYNQWRHGPRIRVAIRGDSLYGTVVNQGDTRRDSLTGDLLPATPRQAHAVRIACRQQGGTA